MRHSAARIKSWLPLTTVMLFAAIGLSASGGGGGAGSGSTPDGDMPALATPLPSLMAAAFNALSESERDEAITDMTRGTFRDVVSSAATPSDPASVLNSGVTKSPYNAAKETTVAFWAFDAQVGLTADFDQNEIWGVATNGRDTATRARIFEGIALERSYLQTADAAFFEGYVRGVVNDRYVQGRWGGQFFGAYRQ